MRSNAAQNVFIMSMCLKSPGVSAIHSNILYTLVIFSKLFQICYYWH